MRSQCSAIKPSGERCRLSANGQHGLCWAHAPENAEHRRRTASKGGRSKPSRELTDLKKQLEDLAADVLAGRIDRGDATVINQILNTRLRLTEVERKVQETQELSEQVEQLEAELRRVRLRGTL